MQAVQEEEGGRRRNGTGVASHSQYPGVMSTPTPAEIWASSDYAPTAARLEPAALAVAERLAARHEPGAHVLDLGAGHGQGTEELLENGFRVTALDPTPAMVEVGRTRVPEARWVLAPGEATGLDEGSVDALASSFAAMLCNPDAGPAEWARVLAPGGTLVMTAWDGRGFLAEMTDRMMAALTPEGQEPADPPHMQWGRDEVAARRLEPWFADVTVEHRDLPWDFASVEAGMKLYLHGSPTHTWSLAVAGQRRQALLDALRGHLEERADADGRIRARAGYALITATRR